MLSAGELLNLKRSFWLAVRRPVCKPRNWALQPSQSWLDFASIMYQILRQICDMKLEKRAVLSPTVTGALSPHKLALTDVMPFTYCTALRHIYIYIRSCHPTDSHCRGAVCSSQSIIIPPFLFPSGFTARFSSSCPVTVNKFFYQPNNQPISH